MNDYFVYIMNNKPRGVLYIRVTNDLIRRVWGHKQALVSGFSKTYKTKRLVYYEHFSDIEAALNREKQIKHWNRQWKINLISEQNPRWNDLYQSLL